MESVTIERIRVGYLVTYRRIIRCCYRECDVCDCVLASRSALIRAAQLRPDLAADYAAVEARIGHRFRQALSMADIITAAETTTPTTSIANWAA